MASQGKAYTAQPSGRSVMKRSGAGTVLALVALVAPVLVGGCKKEAPQAAPRRTVETAFDAGARYALTREQVDRFVKYQTRLVELYDQVLKQREREKAAPIAHLADGGVADPVKVSLQLFEAKA